MADLDLDELAAVLRAELNGCNIHVGLPKARAILSAVLPLALAGERKACLTLATDRFETNPGDESEPLGFHSGWEMCAREIAAAIRARTTLAHIDTLIGKADNKGEMADG